jgi:hypothetical protein
VSDDLSAEIHRLEVLLRASLMLQIQQLQMEDQPSRTDPRSLEALLFHAGVTSPTEIGLLVNKTRQSVSQRLKNEGLV